MQESKRSTLTADDQHARLDGRCVGLIQPPSGPALLTARAIEQGRIADAQHHAAGMADDARAWPALLRGLITIQQGELSRAEPMLLEASTLALADQIGDRDPPAADMLRVGARALVHLGRIYRRTERCEDAKRVHLAAHRLHKDHGSWEEIWESATELGLDADVARDFEDGQRWHRTAIEAAQNAAEQPLKKQALALTNLVTSHEAAEQFDKAVDVAKTARDCWYRYDPTAVTAARADAKLGKALLEWGERLTRPQERPASTGESDTDRQGSCSADEVAAPAQVLGEAVRRLAMARDALLAFGPAYRGEADSCCDQGALAKRLDESLLKSQE